MDRYIDLHIAGGDIMVQSVFRLVLALFAGALIGFEREHRGRGAGFRTNILVSIGSALAMIVSYHMMYMQFPAALGRDDVRFQVDPARIAYGVMTGVGFLGAGAILHVGATVRGLTTAAGLWCVAALGLAFGSGLYLVGITATILVLIVLWLLQELEVDFSRRNLRRLTIRAPFSHTIVDEMSRRFTSRGLRVMATSYLRNLETNTVDLVFEVGFADQHQSSTVERELLAETQITLISVEQV